MHYVLDFKEVDKDSLHLVGGKNASLGEMVKVGIRVPPGFAVTTDSYLSLKDRILPMLSDLNPDDVASINGASEEIREQMHEAPMPDAVKTAIRQAYADLCQRCSVASLPVAVRSSATAEDLPSASFAGQQETYLWVFGADRVIERVKSCWASLYTPRAISYRIKNRFLHEKVLISVGVQKMVNSKAAGVMFTLNPTDGDSSKVVIEGSWGLGETVVSGSVNPDKFVVDKVVMETTEKTVSAKRVACVYDPGRGEVIDSEVAPDMQRACCLDDSEVKELVKTARVIEAHYGRPMDIEWAIDKDFAFPENIFIVQARPETVWSQRKPKSVIGSKSGFQLLMDQAMKRIKIE